MNKSDVLEKLCYYDPRNPDYDAEHGERLNPCYCDNCFYGRTKLAEHILLIQEALNAFIMKHDIESGGIISPTTQTEINTFKKLII